MPNSSELEALIAPLNWEQNGREENSLWAHIDTLKIYYTIEPVSAVFELKFGRMMSEYGYDKLGLFPSVEAAQRIAQFHLVEMLRPVLRALSERQQEREG